jgi:hypothetical protein
MPAHVDAIPAVRFYRNDNHILTGAASGCITCQLTSPELLSSDNAIVLRVASDPKPKNAFVHSDAERTVVEPDTGRPECACFLEVQRWVAPVYFQIRKSAIREILKSLPAGRDSRSRNPELHSESQDGRAT